VIKTGELLNRRSTPFLSHFDIFVSNGNFLLILYCMSFVFYEISFRILFNENGYTPEECLRLKPVIYSNTIQSMLAILHAMNRLQISFDDVNRKVQRSRINLIKTIIYFRTMLNLFLFMLRSKLIMKFYLNRSVKLCKPYGRTMVFKHVFYVLGNIN
jgi:hypothetical protein